MNISQNSINFKPPFVAKHVPAKLLQLSCSKFLKFCSKFLNDGHDNQISFEPPGRAPRPRTRAHAHAACADGRRADPLHRLCAQMHVPRPNAHAWPALTRCGTCMSCCIAKPPALDQRSAALLCPPDPRGPVARTRSRCCPLSIAAPCGQIR